MISKELLAKTQALIAIESTDQNPSGLRSAFDCMVDILQCGCANKNVTIEKFEHGGKPSLLAYKGAQRPKKFHLILNGHIDVVPGESNQFRPSIKDGKLYGRGSYDMKAACVVMADVFCEFVDRVPFAFGLQIVTDEETAGKHGTLYQVEQGVRSDFVISGECGRAPDVYEIANRAKGMIIAEIAFHGKSAHGAYPWDGDNAAVRANHFIHRLHELYPVPTEPTTNSTVTVVGVSSLGRSHTTIPDKAVVKLNARFVAGDPSLSDETKFTAFIKELAPEAEILNFHDFSAAFHTDPNDPQLQLLKHAAEQVEGHPFEFVQRHGTSDARFYGNVGNQACEFGVAGRCQHGDDEHITLQALENYHATLRTFLASDI